MSNEHVRKATLALIPGDGLRRPNASQLHEADVQASLANAAALDRIADALEALVANTAPTPALHHST